MPGSAIRDPYSLPNAVLVGLCAQLVAAGKWEAAEQYLLGFTGWEANGSSLKMFFELRKQKYLEALDM